MSNFFLIICIIYIIISPFYFFESGNPQLADIVFFIGVIPLITTKHIFSMYFKHKIVRYLLWLVILMSAINISYWAYYSLTGTENQMYKSVMFYTFNFLFFLLIISFIKSKNIKFQFKFFYYAIFSSTLIQFILAILKINGNQNVIRPSIFFNNPNQLAYYSLLTISLMTLLYIRYNFNKIIYYLSLIFCFYLVIYSGSRGALSIFLLIIPIIFFKKLNRVDLIIFLSFIFLMPSILNSNFVKEKIELIIIRNSRDILQNKSEIENRGYDRLYKFPKYILYGAGEGKYERFDDNPIPLEIHSGFATVLFSYGFIGFIIFFRFFYFAIKHSIRLNIFLLLPVIIFNLTHNGLRNPLFWGLLAFIYVTSVDKKEYELTS